MIEKPVKCACGGEGEALLEIVKAVAHIGIDFGYGKYELEDKHIQKARQIYEAMQEEEE